MICVEAIVSSECSAVFRSVVLFHMYETVAIAPGNEAIMVSSALIVEYVSMSMLYRFAA